MTSPPNNPQGTAGGEQPARKPLWCNTCTFKGERIGTTSWVCNNPNCTITNSFGTHSLDLCCGPDDLILARVGCASHSSTPHTSAPAPEPDKPNCKHIGGQCIFIMQSDRDVIRAEAAKAAREQDIAKVQTKLDESKKNLYGFNAKEAEWINGFEAGLDAAIDLIRSQQEAEQPKEER